MIKGVKTQPLPIRAAVIARHRGDRGAAVYSISQTLKLLDMREWTWTVFDWLRLYDGFEEHIPPEADPHICMAHALCEVARENTRRKVIASHLATAVEREPWLRYRAQWVDAAGNAVGPEWKPLELGIPWFDYYDARPASAASVRTELRPRTEEDARLLRQWLVAAYLRFATPRRPPPAD